MHKFIIQKILNFTLLLVILPILLPVQFSLHSVPSRMYVGTYAVTNDPRFGSWDVIPIADAFWHGASAFATVYPIMPSSNVLRRVNLTDNNVTFSAVSNNQDRENCDFIFIAAHSSYRLLSVWNDDGSTTTEWRTPNMNFGTGQRLKWVFLYGCSILKNDNNSVYWSSWDSAFSGVQCVLGYASNVRDSEDERRAMFEFWNYWTSYGYSIWDAHKYSTYWNIYLNGTNYSVSPAIVASSPINYIPYPNGPYPSFADLNWLEANDLRAHPFPCDVRFVNYTIPQYQEPPDPPDFIPPVLAFPQNAATNIQLNVSLQWYSVGGVSTKYIVEIYSPHKYYHCDTTNLLNKNYSLDDYNCVYFWRVGTVTSEGTIWSLWQNFQTMHRPAPAISQFGLVLFFILIVCIASFILIIGKTRYV